MKVRKLPLPIIRVSHAEEQQAMREYIEKLRTGQVSVPVLPKKSPVFETKRLKIFAQALTRAGLSAEQVGMITGSKILTITEIQRIARNFDLKKSVEFRQRFHMVLSKNPNIENFFQSMMNLKYKEFAAKQKSK